MKLNSRHLNCTYAKLFEIEISWYLTVCKQKKKQQKKKTKQKKKDKKKQDKKKTVFKLMTMSTKNCSYVQLNCLKLSEII